MSAGRQDQPVVRVFGKVGCGLCEAAKEKIQRLGFEFESLDLYRFTEPHEGWREDNSVSVLSAYRLLDKLPVIQVGRDFMDYPSAMRSLKALHREAEVQTAAAGN